MKAARTPGLSWASRATDIGGEFVQKFIGAELVGIIGIEVGIERVEVIDAGRGFARLHCR